MTIGRLSRYAFCEEIVEEGGRVGLSRRAPFRFRTRSDNRQHVVRQGDTLLSLAHTYFQPLERAAGFWWAIADYQDPPISDPTLALEPGTVIQIPALAVLTDVILGERRRREH